MLSVMLRQRCQPLHILAELSYSATALGEMAYPSSMYWQAFTCKVPSTGSIRRTS